MKGVTITSVGVILMILICCMFFVEDPSGDVSRAPVPKWDTESVTGDSRLKVNVRMERAVPDADSSTCGQRGHSRCCPHGWKSPCLLDSSWVYFDANISVMTLAFSELCLGSSCCFPGQEEGFSRNNTKEKLGFGVATVVNNSIPSSGGGFPYFPDWFRSFSYNHIFSHHTGSQEQRYIIAAALYLISFIIYRLMVLLAIIHKDENDEDAKHNESAIILKFLRFKFSVKWQRNQMQWNQKYFLPGKFRKQCIYSDNIHQSSSILFHDQNSVMNILNEYIFHPWHSKFRVENTESSSDHQGHTDIRCVSDSVFSACHEHYNSFCNPNVVTIQAYPATRFLPDPTFNPDIDLSHVGYRLATLGALPSSVPVSRVRLADAGFYCRGHSEEVTCYSCHVRVSDWSRGGDPMDIHRALSPHCEHVLARDHELAALTSGNIQGMRVNAAHNEGGQTQRSVLNGTPEDIHVEDSEGPEAEEPPESSEAHTSASLPVPSQMPSFPFRPALSSTGASEGPGMSMAASAPANSSFNSRTSRQANLNSLNEAPQNSITIPTTNVMNSHTETVSVQSSIMNSANISTSTITTSRNDTSTVRTNTVSTNSGTVGTGSVSHIQTSSTASISGSSVNVNSAGGRTLHLFPQARLDLGLAVYPMYQSMSSRRRTFTSTWNNSRTPPLEEVLMSGMFYAGYADCVRCFFCGVGLKNWEGTDNVWTEHVRWRPHCGYLRAIKGDDFIRAIQRRLGIVGQSPTGDDQPTAQRSSQDQGIQNEGSSPPTAASSSSISTTQVQPAPAAVLTSASGASFSGTSIASTPTTTTNSSSAVSSRTTTVSIASTATANTSVAASVPTSTPATTNTSVAASRRAASVPTSTPTTTNTSVAASGRAASVPTSTPTTTNTSVAASRRAASVPTSTPATTNTSVAASRRAASVPTSTPTTTNTSVAASGRAATIPMASTATANTSVAASGRAASVPVTSTATTNTSVAASGGTASVPVTSTATSNTSVSSPGRIAPVPRASQPGSVSAPAPTPALSSLASRVVDQAEARRGGGGDWGGRGGGRQGGVSVAGAHNEQGERDRLARLQEENRRLSQRLRCRLCQEAVIDTILMPCGHLVVCATCAATVTSCPLCHFSVRATAHVYLDN